MMKQEELTPQFLGQMQDYDAHQKIVHVQDGDTGLNAFIAVHNSNLGPALGGCRMVRYATEKDALRDVLRLSRGMTYKNALAGLPLGGGKSVLIGDAYKDKTPAMMRAMGRAVEALGGLYVTAEDSGTGVEDMQLIAQETKYVVGLPPETDLGGDPSPYTAYGVFIGIRAAVARRYGSDNLSGLRVAVQGLGHVGYELCRLLHEQGAELVVTDIRDAVLEQARADYKNLTVVSSDEIFTAEANVFAPCALGAQINDATIPQLKVDIIAGAANNQIALPHNGQQVADRGILYVPDYVLNAAGVISAGYEYFWRSGNNPYQYELNRKNLMAHIERIGVTLNRIFNIADARGITPGRAADELAEEIFLGSAAGAGIAVPLSKAC